MKPMKPMKQELLTYLQQFIVRINEGRISADQIQPDHTLEELELDSMDFVELHILLLDEYHIDIFKHPPPDLQTLSLAAFVEYSLDETCHGASS